MQFWPNDACIHLATPRQTARVASRRVRPFPRTVTRYSHSRTHAKHGFAYFSLKKRYKSAKSGIPAKTSCMEGQFIFCRRFFPSSSNGERQTEERRKLTKIQSCSIHTHNNRLLSYLRIWKTENRVFKSQNEFLMSWREEQLLQSAKSRQSRLCSTSSKKYGS